ncbi:hypothetical protein TH25_15040 [Thalassospira profundimaris]|uniref:MAPEG family protein n=1 Tax=Thalassospira profundimaris TaxID=502049 RepID=A0A367X6P0_9PROT|nr:MAPEG family protein [Thalassospira profundimaris]RCK48362.1 hypothetical protein TH25_15040 [Thalassospira profundimaris]
MLYIPATAFLTGIFTLMLVILSLNVSFRRRDLKLAFGDGDDSILRRRMRAHGNFVEYAPMMVLLCAALEITGYASTRVIWGLVAAFIIARLLHALGILRLPGGSQAIGMVLQHIAMLVGAIMLLVGLA